METTDTGARPAATSTSGIHSFSFPTDTRFGVGAIALLPQEVSRLGRRPLLVTDPGLRKLDTFARIETLLRDAGLEFSVYSDVSPNPGEADVVKGVEACRTGRCDLIVGVGGGAALDVAKAIRLMATHPGRIGDYDDRKRGYERIKPDLPPMIAIPTTAGTGSEVGRSTVIVDGETGLKAVIFSPCLMPTLALIDPELMVGLPPHVTAATGMDALTHNVESYLAPGYNPLCDSIALGGARLIARSLLRAVQDGTDLEARAEMAMAALMGAVAFQKGLGVAHSLAHPLSTVAQVHHGLANGILLALTMEFNLDAAEHRLADLATAFGLKQDSTRAMALAAIEFVRRLAADIGIPSSLQAVGVREEMLPELVRQAVADACHHTNPRPVTEQDFEQLYRAVLA